MEEWEKNRIESCLRNIQDKLEAIKNIITKQTNITT